MPRTGLKRLGRTRPKTSPSRPQKPAFRMSRKKSRALRLKRSGTFDIDSVPPATIEVRAAFGQDLPRREDRLHPRGAVPVDGVRDAVLRDAAAEGDHARDVRGVRLAGDVAEDDLADVRGPDARSAATRLRRRCGRVGRRGRRRARRTPSRTESAPRPERPAGQGRVASREIISATVHLMRPSACRRPYVRDGRPGRPGARRGAPGATPCRAGCGEAGPRTTSTTRGRLWTSRCWRAKSSNARRLNLWPSFGTTTAFTNSPRSSSGTPRTATSSTPSILPQHVFHISRVDVEPGRDDQVLLAVHDAEEPVGVARRQVAGEEPPVPERVRGGLGIVPVTGHHLRAADDEFTDLAERQRPHAGVRVHDHRVGVRQRQADGAGPRGPVERAGVRDRARFGEAVALDDDRAGALRELGRDGRVAAARRPR